MLLQDLDRGGRDQAHLIAASIVIPWRDEGDRGESLRYTLRSLSNLPHQGVVVAGDPLPSFVSGVEGIPLPRQVNRHEDSERNVRVALGEVRNRWAYVMHDDMVITRPVAWIGPAHRGRLEVRDGGGDYVARAAAVGRRLIELGCLRPLNFNVHRPFLVDTSRYLKIATDHADLPAGFGLTLYGNLLALQAPFAIDPKLVAGGSRPHPSWVVWSFSDPSFIRGPGGQMTRELFPTPGQYER